MISLIYKRLIQIGKVAGAVSFLIAAPYAMVQYINARDASRVEQTISMFKLYNSTPYSTYREKITNSLAQNKDKILVASKNVDDFATLQFEMLKQDKVETELLLLLDFFDGVAVCVASELCDNDTAIRLFKPRATDVVVNFYQYISVQRATSARQDFGLGVEAIAKSRLPDRETVAAALDAASLAVTVLFLSAFAVWGIWWTERWRTHG